MSYTYRISTKASLGQSEADWTVTLENEMHMFHYQVYANTLVAAVVAKLGEYALELVSDDNAVQTGARKLLKAIENC